MTPRRHRAFVGMVALIVTVLLSGLSVPARAAAAPRGDCSATIVGQKRSGEYVLSPVTCSASPSASLQSVIAVHFVDVNFGGASLFVNGGSCNGGWINLPAGWENTISSTWSPCTTTHFDLYGLGGASETLGVGGGNLSSLHDRTNSVRYT
jgi:hypothetical protein